MKTPRPFSVTLLVLLVLIFAVFKLVRLVQVVQNWSWLATLLSAPPVYLALNGAVWAIVGLLLAGMLWFGVTKAPLFTLLATLLFSFNYWLEYLFVVDQTVRSLNWPFILMVNLLLLGFSFWVLSRPKAKIYFGEKNE